MITLPTICTGADPPIGIEGRLDAKLVEAGVAQDGGFRPNAFPGYQGELSLLLLEDLFSFGFWISWAEEDFLGGSIEVSRWIDLGLDSGESSVVGGLVFAEGGTKEGVIVAPAGEGDDAGEGMGEGPAFWDEEEVSMPSSFTPLLPVVLLFLLSLRIFPGYHFSVLIPRIFFFEIANFFIYQHVTLLSLPKKEVVKNCDESICKTDLWGLVK
jgi:hypothetical protein